jgi:dihydrofolate synthase/folylpolyglutamate synthase
MQQLGKALREFFKYDGLTLVLGCGNDKEVDGIMAEAARITGDVIAVESRHPKAVRPDVLVSKFAGHGITARAGGGVAEGVKMALAGAGKNDLVCAAGSVFVIAEVVEKEW